MAQEHPILVLTQDIRHQIDIHTELEQMARNPGYLGSRIVQFSSLRQSDGNNLGIVNGVVHLTLIQRQLDRLRDGVRYRQLDHMVPSTQRDPKTG